jgi:hypothetical protein
MNARRTSPVALLGAVLAMIIAAVVAMLATSLPAGAAKTPAAPAVVASVAPLPPTSGGGSGGGGGGGAVKAPAIAMPVDFPAAVPLPAGTLLGSTGRAGNWSVLLDVRVGAAQLQKSTLAFYVARGYKATTAYIVHNATYRIVFLAVNRDHSATRSNLAIQVIRI